MIARNHDFDLPIVPEHLRASTPEIMPVDETYYIQPEFDGDDLPNVFITTENELAVAQLHGIIEPHMKNPPSIKGLIAIRRVSCIDSLVFREENEDEGASAHDMYLADLRYITSVNLRTINPVNIEEDVDEITFNAFASPTIFDGFIALEPGQTFDVESGPPRGTYYGDPELYSYMDELGAESDALYKKLDVAEPMPEDIFTLAVCTAALLSGKKSANKKPKAPNLTPQFLAAVLPIE